LDGLQLIFSDDFVLVHILHELEVGSAGGERMPAFKVIMSHMFEEGVPGPARPSLSEIVRAPLAAGRQRQWPTSEVTENMCLPGSDLICRVLTWKHVEETMIDSVRLAARRGNKVSSAVTVQDIDDLDSGSHLGIY
jgi:hypothetical protein